MASSFEYIIAPSTRPWSETKHRTLAYRLAILTPGEPENAKEIWPGFYHNYERIHGEFKA